MTELEREQMFASRIAELSDEVERLREVLRELIDPNNCIYAPDVGD